jgi:lipopolysaccharide biosynthesis glycosyltransferase
VLPRKDVGGLPVFIGSDESELRAVDVAEYSLHRHATRTQVRARRLSMRTLTNYTRPTSRMANGQLWDEISAAPMSTSHAIARFFVPLLCDYSGWALFTDGDVLFRDDVHHLFALAEPQYAVMVVQHPPLLEAGWKKAGHVQLAYPRKNWSSVMLINCGHLANRQLKLSILNTWPGRDLHAFKWLGEHEIGALPARWNHLVGVNPPEANPAIVHYTLGTPDIDGHQQDPFAQEWLTAARVAGYLSTQLGFHTEIA